LTDSRSYSEPLRAPRYEHLQERPLRHGRGERERERKQKSDEFLIGNTHDEDSDREPEPPVKVVDKTPARTTKRNAPAEAPASKAPVEGRPNRRNNVTGNEGGSYTQIWA
jgi:hypothetical protein